MSQQPGPGWGQAPPGQPQPAPPPRPVAPPPPSYGAPPPPTVYERKSDHGFLVRALWYIFVGWWLTGLVMAVAWLLAIIIVGIPVSIYLINRVPTLLTLRPRNVRHQYVRGEDGVVREVAVSTEQSPFLVRAVYFVLVGWWASALWMIVSYLFMLTIIGIPVGLMMANRLPFVFSLHRGYA